MTSMTLKIMTESFVSLKHWIGPPAARHPPPARSLTFHFPFSIHQIGLTIPSLQYQIIIFSQNHLRQSQRFRYRTQLPVASTSLSRTLEVKRSCSLSTRASTRITAFHSVTVTVSEHRRRRTIYYYYYYYTFRSPSSTSSSYSQSIKITRKETATTSSNWQIIHSHTQVKQPPTN